METKKTRVVYAGTPAFAVPSLAALLEAEQAEIVGVFTAPDRPAGRGREVQMSAVKKYAQRNELPLFQPSSLHDEDSVAELQELAPDLLLVAAYGYILPPQVLAIPRIGCINLHASLLPRWRGAAPIQHAILAGDSHTGISIMQMDEGLDTGAVLVQRAIPIRGHDTGGALHGKLARLAAKMIVEHLPALAGGELTPTPQDEAEVCYARKLRKEESRLDWRRDAAALERQVRAFNPWPGAISEWVGRSSVKVYHKKPRRNGLPLQSRTPRTPYRAMSRNAAEGEVRTSLRAQLRILAAYVDSEAPAAAPGTVVRADEAGIAVATGAGALVLTEVQKPGGWAMLAGAYLRGNRITPGMNFALV